MKLERKGMKLFYKKEGSGPPLILLHGNGESHHIFDRAAKALARDWTVWRMDTRGHGKSGRAEELHYQDMAEDTAHLIQSLELKRPLLYGFSDGGIIGLLIASQMPELLSGLIVSGANLQPRGMKTRYRWLFKLLALFSRNPKYPLMAEEPDIRRTDLQKIRIPVYLTAGEKDMIREPHTKFIAENIKNSRLQILEGENHSSYVMDSEKLVPLIKEGAAYIWSL
ncbi:MAG: alpha/beta hydrolase [Firmicutes bacterium]|nr:alpha/beta hydrolase [Bacillota bacterium]